MFFSEIFDMSADSSSLNFSWSLLLHLPQIIEGTNVLSKIYDNLGLLNFLYLLHLIRYIFFILTFFESIHKRIF